MTTDELWGLFPRLIAHFRQRGLSFEDARDLAQETLLAAVRNLSTFRGDSELTTWFFGIAKKQFLLFRRRARAKKRQGIETPAVAELEDGDPGEILTDTTPDPQARFLARERYRAVREAIDKLPRLPAEALTLRLQGHSYREIAARLRCRVNDVSSLIHQARRKLRRVDPGPSSGHGAPHG